MQCLPLTNIHKTARSIEFQLALPGLTKNDLDVYCDGRSLAIVHAIEDARDTCCDACTCSPADETEILAWSIPCFEYRVEFSRGVAVAACSMEHGVLTVVVTPANDSANLIPID